MCDSGQKDGDMLENMCPLHGPFRCSNRRSKPVLQVKWVTPWEFFLIHRQNKKKALQFKLRLLGNEELR